MTMPKSKSLFVRGLGTTDLAHLTTPGEYPVYTENSFDAILYKQEVCFNTLGKRWEHILEYISPYDSKKTPENSKLARAVVGWLEENSYDTFTYQENSRGNVKATTLAEAFSNWNELISSKKQVIVCLPDAVAMDDSWNISDKDYQDVVPRLMKETQINDSSRWKNDLDDPGFLEWALSKDSQLRYFSVKSQRLNLWITNRLKIQRYWGELTSAGKMPEPVVRVIRTQ